MPPSSLHETLRELFAKSPDLMAPLLAERLNLPHFMSPDAVSQSPALAIISTLAHMHDAQHVEKIARQALWTFEALARWSRDADGRLADILEVSLSDAVRAYIEDLMRTEKYEYKSDFARKYFAEGRQEGRQEGLREARVAALLLVLESRGVALDEASKARISSEHDVGQLETWTRKAATASRIEDVLG